MSTFAAIKTEVGQGLPSDALDRLGLWVNNAQNDLLSRSRWSFLEVISAAVALVASQQGYILAGASPVVPDFAGLIDVVMEITASGSRVKLKHMHVQDFDDFSALCRTNAVPVCYSVVGGALPTAGAANILSGANTTLNVWPLPLATAGNGVNLFLRYYRNVDGTQMTADAHLPITPVYLHEAIIQLARATGLAEYDDPQGAAIAQQKADKLIQAAVISDVAFRTGDSTVYALKPHLPHVQGDPRDTNPAGGLAQE